VVRRLSASSLLSIEAPDTASLIGLESKIGKSRIETAQREQRRIEKEEGREWERRFFNRIEESGPAIIYSVRPRPSPPTLW
jgi:hypothetical protein